MNLGFGKIIAEGNGNALIITALLAAAISNALPTPADALYFNMQQKIKEKLEKGEITPKEYWTKDILHYYTFTTAWYIFLVLIVLALGGKYETNAKILIVIISGGFVLSVWKKNIEKDMAIQRLQKLQNGKSS